MADPQSGPVQSVTVTCLTCHERVVVRLGPSSQSVACSFCSAAVQVPALEKYLAQQAANRPLPAPAVDEYALAQPDDGRGSTSPRPAARQTVSKKASATIVLECPVCHERVRAQAGAARTSIECTYCGIAISVPDRDSVARSEPRKIAPRKPEEIGEYAAGAALETQGVRVGGLFDKLAEVRREVAPPPPRWTFFSGVFTFPWRSGVILRWFYLSIGFSAMLGVMLVVALLAGSLSGMAGGVALAFFTLPLIWISLWTCSYAADCGLRVLESTAAGLDQVEAWPEPNWREWMVEMMYVVWAGAIPFTLSYGVARLLNLADVPLTWSMPVAFIMLYPISLLSALEASTIWIPLTRPILGSLIKLWWGWLLFYLETAFLVAVVWGMLYSWIRFSSSPLLLALGPILPAAVLIYFRLLGRLGWLIGNGLNSKRK